MCAEVTAGWVKVQQAPVIYGLSIGPDWLKGRQTSGPLESKREHNLLVKDIVFHGKGSDAFISVIATMLALDNTFVNCGIRPGMMIEKFVESEFGGGDDEITVPATEEDIVRMDFYSYAFEPSKTYTFGGLVKTYGAALTGFIPGAGLSGQIRELIEGVGTIAERLPSTKTEAKKLLASKEIMVVLTGKARHDHTIYTHDKYTRRVSTLGRLIQEAVLGS